MAQHDYNIANAPGAAVRADINSLASAIASQNSGALAPSVTFPNMFWADTTNSLLKLRNNANTAWISIATLGSSSFSLLSSTFSSAVSGNWFGTTARVPQIATDGTMEIGGALDLHADATDTSSYQARLSRSTGANGALNLTQTGTGGIVVSTGGGGLTADNQRFDVAPVGAVIAYAGSAAPNRWLLLNGQNVSRTTYAALFSAIGTTFGSGDGSTTFSLPDLRGRVVAGVDAMGGTAAGRLTGQSLGTAGTLGSAGGEERHQITINEMPKHRHSFVTGDDGSNAGPHLGSGNYEGGENTRYTNYQGGDAAHNVVQPTLVLNYIVYAGY